MCEKVNGLDAVVCRRQDGCARGIEENSRWLGTVRCPTLSSEFIVEFHIMSLSRDSTIM